MGTLKNYTVNYKITHYLNFKDETFSKTLVLSRKIRGCNKHEERRFIVREIWTAALTLNMRFAEVDKIIYLSTDNTTYKIELEIIDQMKEVMKNENS